MFKNTGKIVLSSLIFIFILFLTSCKNSEQENTIYASIYPIQFILQEIAGDDLTIKSILPSGVDAHDYEPTTKEIINIGNAKHLFALGEYEFYLPKLKDTLKNQYVNIHEIGDIQHNNEEDSNAFSDSEHIHENLHVWMDIENMIHMTEKVSKVLVDSYPEHSNKFTNNTNSLILKLNDLEANFNALRDDLGSPKYFITTHSAFSLWEKYNLTQVSILGENGHDVPTTSDLERIADFAKENDINYIFFEQNVSSSYGDTLLHSINGTKKELHNLSNLTSNDLANNENFISLMNKNISTLRSIYTFR